MINPTPPNLETQAVIALRAVGATHVEFSKQVIFDEENPEALPDLSFCLRARVKNKWHLTTNRLAAETITKGGPLASTLAWKACLGQLIQHLEEQDTDG